ncbi:hypothetical protein EB796_003507 [Bugula neritina]|uniref:Uncharacterized protein n=1 Tax=Bugula neritina TaxID=10212 RepID=A0A7J7KKN3_BUGNE|nr:hypothetical protein EB796_003507 [Bugula neritina]
MSSDWVQAMPNLVRRRGGVALPVAGTLRRYSDSDISSIIVSRRASIDSQLSGAEAIKRRRRRGGRERRDHRDLSRVTAADIAAFNAKRSGSGRSRISIDKVKAHIHRRLSDASTTGISNASAHNISFECEDPAEQYAVSSSRRSSVNSSIAAGLTNTAQLEQLTLATYSMFTASALLPRQHSTEKASLHHSRPSSRKISGRSRQLQTPNTAYVNGALDDAKMNLVIYLCNELHKILPVTFQRNL